MLTFYLQRSLRSLAKGKIKTVVQRRIGLVLERHIRLSKTVLVVSGNSCSLGAFQAVRASPNNPKADFR